MSTRTISISIGVVLLSSVISGCVERWLTIRTEPPGARVFLDGNDRGVTPVRLPFDHYGTREVMLRHGPTPNSDGSKTYYRTHLELVRVSAPWYQHFPIDFLAEHVWPGDLVDEHEVDIALEPYDPASEVETLERAARAHGLELGESPEPDPEPDPDGTP